MNNKIVLNEAAKYVDLLSQGMNMICAEQGQLISDKDFLSNLDNLRLTVIASLRQLNFRPKRSNSRKKGENK